MRIFLSVALWGRKYAETFAQYSLASQLAQGNLPLLGGKHQLTYHIVTTRRDADWLRAQPTCRCLEQHCKVVWDLIEDHGYGLALIPTGPDGEKYPFLSRLQNISIARSIEHDVIIFNYADFIWTDGALSRAIDMMRGDVDAILTFCPPVDSKKAKQALDAIGTGERTDALSLPARAGAGIVVDHLHREARRRIWGASTFTSLPTYLIWPVGDQGLLLRAYHQTVLALRVRPDDPGYRGGIARASLDGYFTATLAESGRVEFAADSDQVLVFSLYETRVNSSLRRGENREQAMRKCLREFVSEGQRRFAEVPLFIKRDFTDSAAWEATARESWRILSHFHLTTPCDRAAFDEAHDAFGNIASLEQRWQRPKLETAGAMLAYALVMLRIWFYRTIMSRHLAGRLGRLVKRSLGRARAREWRLWMEHWVFSKRRAPDLHVRPTRRLRPGHNSRGGGSVGG
jgi:hypothetical protein